MAEGMLLAIAQKIIEDLGSWAFQEVGSLWDVEAELENIKNTLSTIQAVLQDAAEQQSHNHQVRDWLEKLKDAVYEADDLLSEFLTEALRRGGTSENIAKKVRGFFSSSNPLVFRYDMSRKIIAMRQKLNAIAEDRKKFHLKECHVEPQVSMDREETHSFVPNENVLGREDDKKAIIKLLLDPNVEENVSVVPIVGIGGLGKTTLAQYVYNDDIVKKHFELKMWVCVSDPFEVKVVIEKIIASATSNKPNGLHMDELQKQLRKEIDGKKYLLVLDDVWNQNYNKWDNLKSLLMGGAKGSKIIITTRAKLVAETTSPVSIYTLKGLSEDQSWSLFEQIAFRKRQETNNPKLVEIGREILGKCQGVPLAIKSIGSVLHLEKTERKWSYVKDSVVANVLQSGDNIFSILKLSYDHLPSHLMSCFAYCSLFPKDYEMDKEKLIQLWIAQGFIQSSNNKNLEDVADEYFNDLLWRSLFEEVNTYGTLKYKMHDLIHDLAQSVAGMECTRLDSYGKNINEKIRHVSYPISIDLSFIETSNLLVKAKKIRSFLQIEYGRMILNESTLNLLILTFRSLRALDLQQLDIRVLPNSIGELTLLKYLDLSWNKDLITLPDSITRLRNLQTLKLSFCGNLKELPRDIRELVNLRHLYNTGCNKLSHMPRGLGQLTCLQTLPLFIVSNDPPSISNHVGGLGELNRLNNLRGTLEIRNLVRLEDGNSESKAANLREKQQLECLILYWDRESNLNANDNDEMLLEGLQPHQNLRELSVNSYWGVRFSSWLLFLTDLTDLNLSGCKRCRDLPPLSQLPSLKDLFIYSMDDLEYISEKDINEEVPVSSTPFFPSLNILQIRSCPNLKGWWRSASTPHHQQHQSLPSFPRLSSLYIIDCPNLTSMPLFPNLQVQLILKRASVKPLQQTMVMASSVPSSSSSPSPLSKLKDMTLWDIEDDGGSLPDGCAANLNSLKSLVILNYPRLTSMSGDMRYLTSLENLHISDCDEFDPFLRFLRDLRIQDCLNLTTFPERISELTSLQRLAIIRCPNLTSLPDGMHGLTSLQSLEIIGCPNLTSLPDGMHGLSSLQKLRIAGCPNLEKKCEKGIGEDWPKIAHVLYYSNSISYLD
jgi:hypothetical protein